MYQKPSLLMGWCLDCHRQPERNLRPLDKIFDLKWQPPANQDELGRELVKEYKLRDTHYLTTCSVCHR